MDQNAKHNRHCVYVINCQLVWVPRYRKPIPVGAVAEQPKSVSDEIAARYGSETLVCEVVSDHIHLFVSAPPKSAPSEVMRLFKGISSRRLKQEFPQIRRQYWGKNATGWTEGHCVGTAGHVSAATIRRYT